MEGQDVPGGDAIVGNAAMAPANLEARMDQFLRVSKLMSDEIVHLKSLVNETQGKLVEEQKLRVDATKQYITLKAAQNVAIQSQTLQQIPRISDQNVSAIMPFPTDMLVGSSCVFDALTREEPDLDFARQEAAKLVRLSGLFVTGLVASQEFAKTRYAFSRIYYDMGRPDAITPVAADWVPPTSLRIDTALKNNARDRAQADYIPGGGGGNPRQVDKRPAPPNWNHNNRQNHGQGQYGQGQRQQDPPPTNNPNGPMRKANWQNGSPQYPNPNKNFN